MDEEPMETATRKGASSKRQQQQQQPPPKKKAKKTPSEPKPADIEKKRHRDRLTGQRKRFRALIKLTTLQEDEKKLSACNNILKEQNQEILAVIQKLKQKLATTTTTSDNTQLDQGTTKDDRTNKNTTVPSSDPGNDMDRLQNEQAQQQVSRKLSSDTSDQHRSESEEAGSIPQENANPTQDPALTSSHLNPPADGTSAVEINERLFQILHSMGGTESNLTPFTTPNTSLPEAQPPTANHSVDGASRQFLTNNQFTQAAPGLPNNVTEASSSPNLSSLQNPSSNRMPQETSNSYADHLYKQQRISSPSSDAPVRANAELVNTNGTDTNRRPFQDATLDSMAQATNNGNHNDPFAINSFLPSLASQQQNGGGPSSSSSSTMYPSFSGLGGPPPSTGGAAAVSQGPDNNNTTLFPPQGGDSSMINGSTANSGDALSRMAPEVVALALRLSAAAAAQNAVTTNPDLSNLGPLRQFLPLNSNRELTSNGMPSTNFPSFQGTNGPPPMVEEARHVSAETRNDTHLNPAQQQLTMNNNNNGSNNTTMNGGGSNDGSGLENSLRLLLSLVGQMCAASTAAPSNLPPFPFQAYNNNGPSASHSYNGMPEATTQNHPAPVPLYNNALSMQNVSAFAKSTTGLPGNVFFGGNDQSSPTIISTSSESTSTTSSSSPDPDEIAALMQMATTTQNATRTECSYHLPSSSRRWM